MKRTTVVLDEDLVARAMKASGARTMHDAIEAGLRELIRSKSRASLRRRLGNVDLFVDLKTVLKRRLGRPYHIQTAIEPIFIADLAAKEFGVGPSRTARFDSELARRNLAKSKEERKRMRRGGAGAKKDEHEAGGEAEAGQERE